jgi:hypothetical protein
MIMKVLETIKELIEENNIDPEEFAKDPYGVIDRLEDEKLKLYILCTMEIAD